MSNILEDTRKLLQAYVDKEHDGSVNKASNALGLPQGSGLLRKWLVGERAPSLSTIAPIYEMLGVQLSEPDSTSWGNIRIPILHRPTGSAFGAMDEMDGSMPFAPDQFEAFGVSREAAMLVKVADDAMSPEFRAGDMALIDRAENGLVEGRYYALLIGGALALRLIQRGIGSTVLKATNPNFRTLEVPDEQMNQVEIVGRIVMAVKRY